MISIFYLILSFFVGVALGLFYFGSLWFILHFLSKTQRPVLLAVGSFFVRLAITLSGFYLIMGGRWERLLIALGGFVVARLFISYRLRTGGKEIPD